ncbi:glycosyltransferase [Rhodopila sp.]|uniref:glycosyltransferase n=1 Tax=Rhodopila sp. TaxID=2480087 RepID=UPI003D12B539
MRLLWLSRYMPLPAVSGDVNYTRQLAGALAQAGISITFLGLVSRETDLAAYRRVSATIDWVPVNAVPRRTPWALVSRLPLQTARFATTGFIAAVSHQLHTATFDAVVIDYYALGWALPLLRRIAPRSLVIYVSHNFEAAAARDIAQSFQGNRLKRAALRINAKKIAALERRLTVSADLLTVITDADGLRYQALGPKRPALTLRPCYAGSKRAERTITSAVPRRLIVLGSFTWIAKQINLVQFLGSADAVFARHGIEVRIIGSVAGQLMRQWTPHLKAIHFEGFVPDLFGCFDQARMGLVIETTGGGFKLKTLDYIFGRLPVAALAHALAGIPAKVQQHFLVQNTLDALVRDVCRYIDDYDRLNTMQHGAFAAADDQFDWAVNGTRLADRIRQFRP